MVLGTGCRVEIYVCWRTVLPTFISCVRGSIVGITSLIEMLLSVSCTILYTIVLTFHRDRFVHRSISWNIQYDFLRSRSDGKAARFS